ncbi:two-component system phosphate regulon sensor histidine kinase PhoR [Paenibacillus sp. SORGH_AS338]|uniref:two-component system histidine kinase PnpS n=1 Tax=Paenibacillus sp. SORGH_AS_0338 TaxID=3041755 RepID=UPI002866BE14|nr:ATP-binding protein [Paenibacillus sp. SORGH_AS_0338]MDR6110416.1 two-component system phosphate regulon sensor histidine kinase PhoR [Paenibacillus sp. SORGH_AS_0338]
MKPFRIRLTLILMILLGVLGLAAALTMGQIFKSSHIATLEDNMVREIRLLETTFDFKATGTDGQPSEDVFQYYSQEAHQIGNLTDSRVTFIEKDGTVIGDSESDPHTMNNHMDREEIRAAAAGGVGSAIRYSATLDKNMLYIAAPVKAGNLFDGYIRLSMSLEAVEVGVRNAWTVMGISLLILFLVAAVVSYRVASGLTKPLEHITVVANRISRLDYGARVRLERRDEIGELGKAIDNMADSLEKQLKIIRDNEDLLQSVLANMTGGMLMVNSLGNVALVNRFAEEVLGVSSKRLTGKSYHELKRHYELTKLLGEGLRRKERIHDEQTLYDPEPRLIQIDGVPMFEDDDTYRGMLFLIQDISNIRRLEKMRSEFVANVSHELKTPIAAVKGFAETLLGGGVQDEQTSRAFLQIIYDESERLNRLIGDILELSKIESKRSPLNFSPIHLQPFFDTIREMLNSSAAKKNITVDMNVPEEMFMEADEDRLRQIFVNLISNAVNYTQDGGKVRLTVEEKGSENGEERILFHVRDTGMGIPKKDLPRIFERFYRVDKARSRSSGGTGLGLSIVKHLVDLHRGTVTVESEVNIGTTFTVNLPLLQEDEPDI